MTVQSSDRGRGSGDFADVRRAGAKERLVAVSSSILSSRSRTLGALETYFWPSDQSSPKHFVVAAEVSGPTSVDDWCDALDAVQRRHPLLRVNIDVDVTGRPFFRHEFDARIPLKVVAMPNRGIEALIEKELLRPFVAADRLLSRAVLVHDPVRSLLVFSVHHSIGDGLSVTYLIRDLMHALAGSELEELPLPVSQEVLRPEAEASLELLQPGPLNDRPTRTLERDEASLRVRMHALPPELGARLLARARSERTSVHGAIVAALILEGLAHAPDWHGAPVRVLSPINIRSPLGRADDFALSISIGLGHFAPAINGDLWALARDVTTNLEPARSAAGFSAACDGLIAFIADQPGVGGVAAFEPNYFPVELMVSNLGQAPYETQIGTLRLEALWGPSVFVGIEGEQMIGVCSIGSTIRLVQNSFSPIDGLLEGVERRLVQVSS
jgi:hypothetical protein